MKTNELLEEASVKLDTITDVATVYESLVTDRGQL